MGYRIIKQYYEMKQNDTFENNNNRGNKTKTIRRGYFMKYFLIFLLAINGIFGSVSAQQYPVRLVPVVFPPYNVRLSDYALNSEPKLQLQVLMTDLLEPPHKTGIKFSLESGGRVIAVSNPFVNGLEPFMLHPGSPISLSNLDLKPLFKLENLSGISPANYAKALPDGLYQYCFQAYDFYTKNNLSQKSCASVYQVLYEPPFLNLPQKGEKVTKKAEFQGVVFNWSPRQIAPNTKYIFTLKEIWDKQRDPVSAFLAARVLWKEESFAPSLYYGVDKTQLIPGKRYAWQVQAVSGTPQYNHSPIQEGGVYKNNGLSEIFFFDYVENCPVPAFLMAKTTARGRAEIQWTLQGASSKQFRVEYRKKGSSSPWLSETSYQTSAILSGLENNTEYEYRVGAVCGENKSFDPNDLSQADAFAYSGVQYFTTNFSNQNKNSAQCGVMPHVDLANKKPYDRQLTPNEVFTAGDFPVTVISAQGTAGNYTGEGFIQVPYLADTKIKVKFNNIQLNSDKQLINGTVETAYDIDGENIIDLKSVGELLSELSDIFKKENLTEEDEKKYDKIRQQLDFYFSNIDDIEMPEEDKRKFERIKANIFFASSHKMTDKERENASKAAEAGQELYKKYQKEFNVMSSAQKIIQEMALDEKTDEIKNAKNIIYFVNGHYSRILPGPSYGLKKYWDYFDDNTNRHQKEYMDYFNFPSQNTVVLYLNGSSIIGFDKDFSDRFRSGQMALHYAIKKIPELVDKTITFVAHSEGVGYAAGAIETLYKNKAKIKEVVYLSADEGAEKGAYTNSSVPTYQIEYAYFDTDRDKGCIAHYDMVIGTHLRYLTYKGIKGVTKFGIAIRNDLGLTTIHGTTAFPSVIPYIESLKAVKYTQNLNSEGKIFYKQQPAGKYLFWKIDNQFIDANHPKFDIKTGKINHNLKCRK